MVIRGNRDLIELLISWNQYLNGSSSIKSYAVVPRVGPTVKESTKTEYGIPPESNGPYICVEACKQCKRVGGERERCDIHASRISLEETLDIKLYRVTADITYLTSNYDFLSITFILIYTPF